MKKVLIGLGVLGLMFSGCTHKYWTKVEYQRGPFYNVSYTYSAFIEDGDESVKDSYKVTVNADYTIVGWRDPIKKTNLKYLMVNAANFAKSKGYKYFKVVAPELFVKALREHKANTFDKVYKMCDSSKDQFNGQNALLFETPRHIVNYTRGEKGITKPYWGHVTKTTYRCETIAPNGLEFLLIGKIGDISFYRPVQFFIKLTNEISKEDRYNTFSVDEILNSDLAKGLNPKYTKPKVLSDK